MGHGKNRTGDLRGELPETSTVEVRRHDNDAAIRSCTDGGGMPGAKTGAAGVCCHLRRSEAIVFLHLFHMFEVASDGHPLTHV